MESKHRCYIFPIPEIQQMIFDYLNPFVDFYNLILVNKHTRRMVFKNSTHKELLDFQAKNLHGKLSLIYSIITDRKNEIFIAFCVNNYTKLAWFYHEKYSKLNIHLNYDQAFTWTCCSGDLGIAKWLYQIGIDNDTIPYAFRAACYSNKLEVAKWLYQYESNLRNNQIYHDRHNFFRTFCEKGAINVLQWLHQLNINLFNDVDTQNGFLLSCVNGHLSLSQWLYHSDVNHKINIHDNNEQVFRVSCERGQLEVAIWLYQLDPDHQIDIHASDDYAFKMSFTRNHTNVTKWLASLSDKYELEIIHDTVHKWEFN